MPTPRLHRSSQNNKPTEPRGRVAPSDVSPLRYFHQVHEFLWNRTVLSIALATLVVLTGCGAEDKPKSAQTRPPPLVLVATVEVKDAAQITSYIGHAEADEAVDIKARVLGNLEKIHLKQGADVQLGQVLFNIEAAQYEAVAAQRRASEARARAVLINSELKVGRYNELLSKQVASPA
jgi:membrane fusion protein, multidrug efflux system